MSALTSLARAQAVEAGVAQLIATVAHVHVSSRPLVFVPLGLAGEAHAPLAAMVGDDRVSPRLLVVTQPRNRDLRFAFAAELADSVIPYIESFFDGEEEVRAGRDGETRLRFADAPQLVVPGPAATRFARLLGRSTRFRRSDGEFAVSPSVPELGRWLSFLAERAEYPGSCLMLAATDVLSRHWASGQSDVEDLNLAALVGWIDPPPGLTGPQAAALAEDPVASPPSGPVTDPTFDNEVLAPLIAACQKAEGGAAEGRARRALTDVLAGQLAPTWQLLWRAIDLMRGLPAAEHVAVRWDGDKDAFTQYDSYLESGGFPQPRRDSAVAAARRLNWLERAQAVYCAQQAFDDPLVMAEYRLSGEAFAGTVIAAEPDRIDSAGPRRKLRPLITVATADSVPADVGTVVTARTRPGQQARVVAVGLGDEPGRVVLELSGGMGRSLTPVPGSVPGVGEWLCYSALTDGYQSSAVFPPAEETPWTHGGPPEQYVPAAEDMTEEWS